MTVSDVVTVARDQIGDAGGTRWTDARLIRYASDAQRIAFELRADLFLVGNEVVQPSELTALGDTFVLGVSKRAALAAYVAACALGEDGNDAANRERSAALMEEFRGRL